jgi:putative redox protein
MKINKIKFKNQEGEKLTANLELPADRNPASFALFAHCFTCNKNFSAFRKISRALTSAGVGVLRFDFTGLGESEGDFADTNFSSNIQNLKAASDYLKANYKEPSLLIGHSLGGAAVLYAAAEIDSVKAIATIGAPSDPKHVTRLISHGLDDINTKGYAVISIGGRPFTIKKQFIDDLKNVNMSTVLKKLKKAILIAHSPQDNIVGIDNAAEIFMAARHPKSFVSLDGADHLLSKAEYSAYIGSVIARWAKRYIPFLDEEKPDTHLQVVANLGSNDKFTTRIKAGKHFLIGDEPEKYGGNDFGPAPYDFVSAGLASCTAMKIKMYADRKKWKVDEIYVHIEHNKVHAEDCGACENSAASKIDRFTRVVELKGDLDEKQRQRLLEIAKKYPVHKTLRSDIDINTELKS